MGRGSRARLHRAIAQSFRLTREKHSVKEPIKSCPAEGAHEHLMLTHTRDGNLGLVELLTVPFALPDLRSAPRAGELPALEAGDVVVVEHDRRLLDRLAHRNIALLLRCIRCILRLSAEQHLVVQRSLFGRQLRNSLRRQLFERHCVLIAFRHNLECEGALYF